MLTNGRRSIQNKCSSFASVYPRGGTLHRSHDSITIILSTVQIDITMHHFLNIMKCCYTWFSTTNSSSQIYMDSPFYCICSKKKEKKRHFLNVAEFEQRKKQQKAKQKKRRENQQVTSVGNNRL